MGIYLTLNTEPILNQLNKNKPTDKKLSKMDSTVEIKEEKPDFKELVYYPDLQVKQEPLVDPLNLEWPKKCSLCSKNYDHHTFLLTTGQIHSFCTVFGVCSGNSCFEEIFKSFELCADCTALVAEIDTQIGILRNAELCLRRSVQDIGSHLSDRLVATEDPGGTAKWCLQNFENLKNDRVKELVANELGTAQKFGLIATSKSICIVAENFVVWCSEQ